MDLRKRKWLFNIKLDFPLKDVFLSSKKEVEKKSAGEAFHNCAPSQSKEIFPEEIEEIKKVYYHKGFEEGRKKGVEEGRSCVRGVLKAFNEALSQIEKERKKFLERSEKDLIEIALAVAKKIIQKEVEVDREIIRKVAGQVLRKAMDSHMRKIVVRVNPKDWEALMQGKENIFPLDFSGQEISLEVEKDASIQSGGCIVETEKEIINASVESQLEEIERVLKGEEE